jgi:bacterioferritin
MGQLQRVTDDPPVTGAVTHNADPPFGKPAHARVQADLVALLGEALGTELVRLTRFESDARVPRGQSGIGPAGAHCALDARELIHAARIVERIVQLGGTPEIAPECLDRRIRAGHAGASHQRGFVQAQLLMMRVNLEVFGKLLVVLGDGAPSIAVVLEGLIGDAHDHVAALQRCVSGRRRAGPMYSATRQPCRAQRGG